MAPHYLLRLWGDESIPGNNDVTAASSGKRNPPNHLKKGVEGKRAVGVDGKRRYITSNLRRYTKVL